jgi:hypothetical protein
MGDTGKLQDLGRNMRYEQLKLQGVAVRLRAEVNYAREVYEDAFLEFEEAYQEAHELVS